MNKQLLIMRHAKSSHDDAGLSDHDRPLNGRGERDAPRMASWLNEQNLVPDIIISSSATRARTTAELIAENLNTPTIEVEIVEDLYLAPPDIYLDMLSRLADQYYRPMFVGHNPGMESLAERLANEYIVMPTSAIAVFDVKTSKWATANQTSVFEMIEVARPKQLFG